MAGYTNNSGDQQPYQDWDSFPQSCHFLQAPTSRQLFPNTNKDSTLQASIDSGAFFSELPADQQAVAYGSNLNDYFSFQNSINQDASYVPFDEAALPTLLEDRQNFTINPQFSSNPYNSFDMSTASSIPSAARESSDKHAAEPGITRLRCKFPDCSQDRDFPTESVLRKHQEKHSKPYMCQVSNCPHPRFGDKGGLDRHKREVHGTKTYCCPDISCKRHTRGFPRKYNLFEHQRRCHPTSSASMQKSRDRTYFDGVLSKDLGRGDGEPLSSEMMITGDMTRHGSGKLQEQLEKLFALREEFENNIMELDSDIEALKRTLDVLGETLP